MSLTRWTASAAVKLAPNATPPEVGVAEIFEAVSHELTDLAGLTQRLQTTLGPMLVRHASDAICDVEDVQALDLISQRLAGLSSFLAAFATSLPGDWRADPRQAADQVTLADLAGRLSQPSQPRKESGGGDFELF